MKNIKTSVGIRRELAKAKRFMAQAPSSKCRSEWREAFDEGVVQALSWVLGDGTKPTRGFELRFRREAKHEGY